MGFCFSMDCCKLSAVTKAKICLGNQIGDTLVHLNYISIGYHPMITCHPQGNWFGEYLVGTLEVLLRQGREGGPIYKGDAFLVSGNDFLMVSPKCTSAILEKKVLGCG